MDRGFRNGAIMLDTGNDTYFPGQLVTGRVEFQLESQITFRAICLRVIGEAKIHWSDWETETIQGNSRTREVPYDGREEYINFMQYIVGNSSAGPTTLNPGKHSYPFQYQLPFQLPSSFNGEKGKVWYRLVANIDQSGMGPNSNEEIFKIFYVIAPLDLNMDRGAKKPIKMDFEEVYSCCFCESGPLNINIKLPASGFCPGQVIPIEIMADNKSNVEVQKMLFTIYKKEAYHSLQPRSDYYLPEERIASSQKGAIPCDTKRNFTVELRVPDMIAPNLTNCSLINVCYLFKVEIEVSGCNEGNSDEADIILGLIPISGILDADYVHPMKDKLPQQPIPKQEIIYPTNTPYPTPIMSTNVENNQTSPYPNKSPYPAQIGFNTTDPTSPPYSFGSPYPDSQSGYPYAPVTNYPAGSPGYIQPYYPQPTVASPSAPTLP